MYITVFKYTADWYSEWLS